MTRRNRAHHAGVTTVELMISVAITGLVGMGVAAMLLAVTYGTSSRNEMRTLMIKHKTLGARLATAMRGSRMVLAAGDNYLVLWTADSRADDAPNLSEIRLLERDADTGELWSYKASFDPGLTEEQLVAADTQYALTDDFAAITTALKGGGSFPGERWATGVVAWTCTFDAADVQQAALISYRVTLESGELTDTGVGAAKLRNSPGE